MDENFKLSKKASIALLLLGIVTIASTLSYFGLKYLSPQGGSSAANPSSSPTPTPDPYLIENLQAENAVPALVSKFDNYSLVALGENHELKEAGDLYTAIIKNKDFPKKARYVVMECGNSKYQDIADKYVRGEDVSQEEVQKIWRNMSFLMTCDSQAYQGVYETMREVNKNLPDSQKLKVLLAEPPIDWSTVKSQEDAISWVLKRETSYSSIVTSQVLDKGEKALMIIGSLHLEKAEPVATGTGKPTALISASRIISKLAEFKGVSPSGAGGPGEGPSRELVLQTLERLYPGKTYVTIMHSGLSASNDEFEKQASKFTTPALIQTKKSWLGNQAFNTVITVSKSTKKISEMIDGYLFLGKREELRLGDAPKETYQDTKYMEEIRRRARVMGVPSDLDERIKGRPIKYIDNFGLKK